MPQLKHSRNRRNGEQGHQPPHTICAAYDLLYFANFEVASGHIADLRLWKLISVVEDCGYIIGWTFVLEVGVGMRDYRGLS